MNDHFLTSNSNPLLWFIYGLFKAEAIHNEYEILKNFASRQLPHLEQDAISSFPTRIQEAYLNTPYLSEALLEWLFNSRETTNYTYDLSDASFDYLTSFVSIVTQIDFASAQKYIDELKNDHELSSYIQQAMKACYPKDSDSNVYYCRRFGWYAFVRHFKPKVVVETGLDKGLGSVVLTRALMKNSSEGSPGRYYGIDITNHAGAIFSGQFAQFGEIIRGDSVQCLKLFPHQIDFLIADSSHTAGYEDKEYEAIETKLSHHAVVISDADFAALGRFAKKTDRKFLYWKEWPKNHFVSGWGIAIAYR